MDRKKRNIHRKGTDPDFQTGKSKNIREPNRKIKK